MNRREDTQKSVVLSLERQIDKIKRDLKEYGKHYIESGQRKDKEDQSVYILALGFFLYHSQLKTGEKISAENFLGSYKIDKKKEEMLESLKNFR